MLAPALPGRSRVRWERGEGQSPLPLPLRPGSGWGWAAGSAGRRVVLPAPGLPAPRPGSSLPPAASPGALPWLRLLKFWRLIRGTGGMLAPGPAGAGFDQRFLPPPPALLTGDPALLLNKRVKGVLPPRLLCQEFSPLPPILQLGASSRSSTILATLDIVMFQQKSP